MASKDKSDIKNIKFDMQALSSKFGKKIGIQIGFHDPKVWFDTGSYVLNYCISNDFFKGVPLEGKVTMFAGESGSGKSLFGSGAVVKDALDKGVIVQFIDTEDAAMEEWIQKAGVDTSLPNYIRTQTNSMKNILLYITAVVDAYNAAYADVDEDDQPGLLFVIDSFSAMFSEGEEEQQSNAEFKTTDGARKAIDNAKFINACLSKCASKKIGFVIINHVSTTLDLYSAPTISGGKKCIFLASIVVQMDKNILREDEFGEKTTEQTGIKTSFKVQKTRFTQPFQSGKINVPYKGGIQRYSGLFDFFKDKKMLKEGEKANTYVYTSLITGEQLFCERRKNITNEMWDAAMKDFMEAQSKGLISNKEETQDDILDSIIAQEEIEE